MNDYEVHAVSKTSTECGNLVETFEMLVERMTNVEMAMKTILDDRIAGYEMMPAGSHIPGGIFGCQGLIIEKHCTGPPMGLVYVDVGRDILESLSSIETIEWCRGISGCWMDEYVSAEITPDIMVLVKSNCEELLEEYVQGDGTVGMHPMLKCKDVGMPECGPHTSDNLLANVWFEVAVRAKIPGVIACGEGGVVLKVPEDGGIKWIVQVIIDIAKLMETYPIVLPKRMKIAQVPLLMEDIMVACARSTATAVATWQAMEIPKRINIFEMYHDRKDDPIYKRVMWLMSNRAEED